MARSTGKSRFKRWRVLRWLPWVLLSMLSVSATIVDITYMRYTRRALADQQDSITELEKVAVAQFTLFQAHVAQCSCTCGTSL